jgi:hypothetical protein
MASTKTEQPLLTYRGNCHCKAFVYEVKLPVIRAVKQCNCSICHKKGYLWVFPETVDHFKFVKGDEDAISSYTFNAKSKVHKVTKLSSRGIPCHVPSQKSSELTDSASFTVLSDMCNTSHGCG